MGGRVAWFPAFRIRHWSVLGEWPPRGPGGPLKLGCRELHVDLRLCGGAPAPPTLLEGHCTLLWSLIRSSAQSTAESPAVPPAPLTLLHSTKQEGGREARLGSGVQGGPPGELERLPGVFCGDVISKPTGKALQQLPS